MTAFQILVVDDESGVRDALRAAFEAEGWRVLEAGDSAAMFELMQAHRVDLVTLDLMLGNEDGLELAGALRQRWNTPVLMVTGKATPYDRLRGLESGADDYIVKPFHIREVVLRVRRTLELYRRAADAPACVTFDHAVFEPKRGLVRHVDGSTIDLTGTELRLLELFVRHAGRILSRDEISRALHGRDWSPEDRTIDGHVARLRRKLGAPGVETHLIRSVRGVGYVFTGEVTPGGDAPDDAGQ